MSSEKKPQSKIRPIPHLLKNKIDKFERMRFVVETAVRELNQERSDYPFLMVTDGKQIAVEFSEQVIWDSLETKKPIVFDKIDDVDPFKEFLEERAFKFLSNVLGSRKYFIQEFSDEVIKTFKEMYPAEGKTNGE